MPALERITCLLLLESWKALAEFQLAEKESVTGGKATPTPLIQVKEPAARAKVVEESTKKKSKAGDTFLSELEPKILNL